MFNLDTDNLNEEEYKEKLKEEIVDVFSYLVMLGNLLEMDLEQEYYKKMEKNKIKYKQKVIK